MGRGANGRGRLAANDPGIRAAGAAPIAAAPILPPIPDLKGRQREIYLLLRQHLPAKSLNALYEIVQAANPAWCAGCANWRAVVRATLYKLAQDGHIARNENGDWGIPMIAPPPAPEPPVVAEEPPARRRRAAPAPPIPPDLRAAYRWLEKINADLAPSDMHALGRGGFLRLPTESRERLLRLWWNANDVQLKLTAAIGFIRWSERVQGPDLDAMRNLFAQALRDGPGEKERMLAAQGLLLLARYGGNPYYYRREQPDIRLLDEALARPESRAFALRAILALTELDYDYYRWPHARDRNYLTHLGAVINDPNLSNADRLNALLVSRYGEGLPAGWEATVRHLLRADDLDNASFVAIVGLIAGARGSRELVALVGDATLSLERRQQLLDACAAIPGNCPSFDAFAPVLLDANCPTELLGHAIRTFAGRVYISEEYLTRVLDGQHPIEIRAAALSSLWADSTRIGSVLHAATLLQQPDASQLFAHAFPDGNVPRVTIRVTDDDRSRIIEELRRGGEDGVPSVYHLALARLLGSSPRVSLGEEDRQVVVNTLIRALTDKPEVAVLLRDDLLYHARTSRDLTRALANNPHINIRDRLEMALDVDTGLSDAEIAEIARNSHLNLSSRQTVGNAYRQRWGFTMHPALSREIDRAVRAGGDDWQALLGSRDLFSQSIDDVFRVAKAAGGNHLVRRVALARMAQLANAIPEESRRAIGTELFEMLRSPDTEAPMFEPILEAMTNVRAPQFSADRNDILGIVVRDGEVPSRLRAKAVHLLGSGTQRPGINAQLWAIAAHDEAFAVRHAALQQIVYSSHVSGDDVTAALRALETAATDTAGAVERERANRAWERIADLSVVFDADPGQLVRYALAPASSESLRESALRRLQRETLTPSQLRPFWGILEAQQNGAPAQNAGDQRLREQVHDLLRRHFGRSSSLSSVVNRGPSHPLWPYVSALAQTPDQGLVSEAFATLQHLPVGVGNWRAQTIANVPDAAVLPVYKLFAIDQSPGLNLLNNGYARLQNQRTEYAELTQAVVQVATKPQGINTRVRAVIDRCRLGRNDDDVEGAREDAAAISQLARYATLEAQLEARKQWNQNIQFHQEPDLPNPDALPRPRAGARVTEAAQEIRDRIRARLLPDLGGVTAEQLAKIEEQTIAPLVLAGQYSKSHRSGLPLLGKAVAAASGGRESWERWRYDRPEARAQIAHLDDAGVATWRQDLQKPIGISVVPDDVREAANTIRKRFRQIVGDGQLPTDLRDFMSARDVATPAQRIKHYNAIVRAIGATIGGKQLDPDASDLTVLAPDVAAQVREALANPNNKQALLALRNRFERAIDLTRLAHCDERALARNELRAAGEAAEPGSKSRTEGAIAHFNKMRYAFTRGATRDQRNEATPAESTISAALDDGLSALGKVKTFATSNQLVVEECSDLKTLIEIGNRPYGQGSCQNYASVTGYNQALLAYVTDAMTKAIVVRAASPDGVTAGPPLARAICRLGRDTRTNAPVVVVEKTYAPGSDAATYQPMITEAAKSFAAQRGWRVGWPGSAANGQYDAVVVIPKSQNSVQYEDGAYHIQGGGQNAQVHGEYRLGVHL